MHPKNSTLVSRLRARNRALERELAEEKRKLDQVLTDVNYVGGLQYWIRRHDDLLFRMVSGNPPPTMAETPAYDPCAECMRNGGICGNTACPKRLLVTCQA